MAPGKKMNREMARHLTKLRAGLVPDDVKEDSTGPVPSSGRGTNA